MTRSKNEAIQFLMISNALVIDFYAFTLIVTFSKYHTADICRLNSVQPSLMSHDYVGNPVIYEINERK